MSKQIAVYVDDDMHELIGLLAKKHSTSMSRLVLAAIEDTYEDQLDAIAGELGLAEYLADPASAITWEELKHRFRANAETKERDP
jgi:predicted transcriptional regulator